MKISIKSIQPSPFQVREQRNGGLLAELQASMKEAGLAVPVKVRPNGKKYELVYGHRRVAAAKALKWKEIEAIVEHLTDEEAMIQGLAENIQRDDLEPLEEARAYQRMIDEFGRSQESIAKELGVDQTHISRMLALLDEPATIQKKLIKGTGSRKGNADGITLTEYQVRAARSADLPKDEHTKVLLKAAKEELTATQTAEVAKSVKAAGENPKIKEYLIESEFSDFVHDPKRIEHVVKKRGGIDPTIKSPPKPVIREKAVADFLRYMKQMRWWIEAFDKALDTEQVSPEGKPFVAERLKTVRNDINRILKRLEE